MARHFNITARHYSLLGLVLLVICAVLVISLIEFQQPLKSSDPTTSLKAPLTIISLADVQGRLQATQCGVAQPGGVDRLQQFSRQFRPTESLLLVAGGSGSGVGKADLLRWQTILQGQRHAGLLAHNLGAEEATLSLEQLQRLEQQTSVPWLASNLLQPNGDYWCEPVRVVQRADQSLLILGVISPGLVVTEQQVLDPVQAIEKILRDYAWSASNKQRLIVLGDLLPTDAVAVQQSLPASALLILRPRAELTTSLFAPGAQTTICTSAGRGVNQIRLDAGLLAGQQSWQVTTPLLDEQWQPPQPAAWLTSYFQDLPRQTWTSFDTDSKPLQPVAMLTQQQSPLQAGYAGQHQCQQCHQSECQQALQSAHARAWQTLIDRGQQFELQCQQCHTTGFGNRDCQPAMPGFLSAQQTPHLLAVQCESCHGPSQAHALNPTQPTPWVARQSCTQCHTSEHDPNFAWDTHWPTIKHGQ